MQNLNDVVKEEKILEENILPEWAETCLSKGKIKPRAGVQVTAMTLKKEWTDAPSKGDRNILLWPLTAREEENCMKAAGNSAVLLSMKLAKAHIRYIDGHMAEHGKPTSDFSPESLWDEVGGKGRSLILNYTNSVRNLSETEQADFLLNCMSYARISY